jgi:hypothetical protein
LTVSTSQIADCVSAYAARLQAVIGTKHYVASPLGAWLLLALAAPASTGADRDTLTEVLGCAPDTAARTAANLLGRPHPVVASAAAVWTASGAPLSPEFARWRAQLPPAVTTGDLPDQAGLDAWAREHTFGLIDRFPIQDDGLYLVLATALATKVSWTVPFELAPADSLGRDSPWATRLRRVLRTPAHGGGHAQYIAVTPDAGDVIVHVASAIGGLLVVSVAAAPDVPAGTVLAAAHRIGIRHATGSRVDRRHLADLPLGDGPLWRLRETTGMSDNCIAVLPAWSASSRHELTDPSLGFAAAKDALAPIDPWQARQSAVARYSRTGFEAAAATALGVALAARVPAKVREAELRFAHPYAVVAMTTNGNGKVPSAAGHGPWHGLPVFSAWVSEPEDATDDSDSNPAGQR